jgi:protein-tyrosine-phosphatase
MKFATKVKYTPADDPVDRRGLAKYNSNIIEIIMVTPRPVPATPPVAFELLAHPIRWQLVTALIRSDYKAGELVGQAGQPPNLVSYHLRKLHAAGVVAHHRSSADGRDLYYHLDVERLHELYLAGGAPLHLVLTIASPVSILADLRPTRVLFLCTHNSARSQMAEALLRKISHGTAEALSAGSEAREVHPLAIQVMREHGLDIRGQHSKHLDDFRGQNFDYVITVCDRVREVCPTFPGEPSVLHWSLPDPIEVSGARARLLAFRQTADQLAIRIRYLLMRPAQTLKGETP